MATKVIRHQAAVAVPQGERAHWQKARDFLSTVGELLSVYFSAGASFSKLEEDYWTTVSEKQKTERRADLMGLRQ